MGLLRLLRMCFLCLFGVILPRSVASRFRPSWALFDDHSAAWKVVVVTMLKMWDASLAVGTDPVRGAKRSIGDRRRTFVTIWTLTLDVGRARLYRVLEIHDRSDRRLLRLKEPVRRFVRVLVPIPGPRRLKSHLVTFDASLDPLLDFVPYLFGRWALLRLVRGCVTAELHLRGRLSPREGFALRTEHFGLLVSAHPAVNFVLDLL